MTGNAATLWRWVADGEGDLVITDVIMPDENGLDLIPRIKKIRPELRIIVMSAQNTLLTAVKATERGAFEYLPKPFDLRELVSVVERALTAPLDPPANGPEEDSDEQLPLIGRSPAMQEIYRVIARLMGTDLTVMIIGESGTGKELVARALHDFGKRRDGPFVAINMAAIPRELIESELFGHEKGAFTGATARSMGRFEQAQGGTLFLDEIGDMPLEAQTRLLRVLQEGEYTAVGGRAPIRADVRIIAATHRDLRQLIRQGLFREDLFYRLNVAPIRLPPLRERTRGHSRRWCAISRRWRRARGCRPRRLDQAAMERLRSYRWPGNVRELENLMRRLAALYSQEVIGVEVIEAELGRGAGRRARRRCAPADEGLGGAVERHITSYFAAHKGGLPAAGLYDRVLREIERPLIVADPRRHPRQPDQGGASAGPQPQYAAQENPRIGHPGGARPKIVEGRSRARRRWQSAADGRAGAGCRSCRRVFQWRCPAGGLNELMRQVRMWAGWIGLRRKLALALAMAALASGIATYLALTGAPPFGPRPNAVLSLLNLDLVLLLALGALVAKRLRAGLGRAAARPRRLAAAGPAGRAVQPDRGDADDHRRGFLLPVLQLRRRILVQRQGAHRDLRIASRSPKPICTSISRRSAPMRWRWRTTSTATPSRLQLEPATAGAGGLTAQAATARADRGDGVRRARPRCWRAPACPSRLALSRSQQGALRVADEGEVGDHDRRQRRPGARARPPRPVRPTFISMSAASSSRG